LFISYLFGNLSAIGSPGIFWYGGFIFLFVYSMTELMDGNEKAYLWEAVKCLVGLYLLYQYVGWFGLTQWFVFADTLVFSYLLVSMYLSINFSIKRSVSVPSESN
ncbi:MAG: hypothetical protein RL131_982, partial [Bacteroidota bacterium]